jgi:predicted XRE-type DNA-binding protein
MKSKTVSDQLRQAIVNTDATQAEISQGTGVDLGVLSRFMRSDRGISDTTMSKLCNYLALELHPMRRGGK